MIKVKSMTATLTYLSDKAEILKKILDGFGLDLRITYSCND